MKFLKTISLILTTSIYANSSSILPDSSNLGSSNWYDSTWLGVYYESSNGWVYHATLGWIYIPSSDLESLWIYNHEIKWFWTTSSIYPWIYVDKKNSWRYYRAGLGFYNPDTQNWASKDELISEFNQTESYTSEYYASGALVANSSISSWFDRSLEINGLQLFVSGEVGGQIAVPEEWAKKVAQTVKLLTDPMGEGIDIPSQERMINVLKGTTGTWHADYPTAQRIAYGGGSDYSPNPLTDNGILSYNGYQNLDNYMMNDMIWYRNSSDENKEKHQ